MFVVIRRCIHSSHALETRHLLTFVLSLTFLALVLLITSNNLPFWAVAAVVVLFGGLWNAGLSQFFT